ncbi:MAG: sulfatase [Actinomycetota bacterium]|nr:sulfatase [Actinomycetota bacterium]
MQGIRRTRTRRAGAALIAALAAACLLVAQWSGEPSQAASAKPNIIVITTDDQTVRDMVAMPQTQAHLGVNGATFSNSFASYPLCCPSRATFVTGQYAHNHNVLGNTAPDGGYPMLNDKQTVPVWMQGAGYHTVHVGKMPNGYGDADQSYVPPGWRLPDGEFYGFVPDPPSAYYGFKLNENGVVNQLPATDYQTDVYAERANMAINSNLALRPDTPLFMMLQFFAPHDPALPAQRHVGAFSTAQIPKGKSFNEKDVSDKPAWLRSTQRMGAGLIGKVMTRYRNRLASLLAVDEAVNSIVNNLLANGILDNTYIIFTSDNGFMQGQHRLHQGKFVAYDESSKVPLLIRGPGIVPGTISRELVSNVDLVPTVLDIGKGAPGITVDGRSILPYARDPRLRSKRPILLETGRAIALADPASGGGAGAAGKRSKIYVKNSDLDRTAQLSGRVIKLPKYRALRTRRYLLIKSSDGGRELYDMPSDPLQIKSVWKDPRYAPVRKWMLKKLAKLTPCVGTACNAELGKPPKLLEKRKKGKAEKPKPG